MRLRIRSVKNISQVTRALEAVSASKVRKAVRRRLQPHGLMPPRPGRFSSISPASRAGPRCIRLLARRPNVSNILVVVISGDRGLAGAYNSNVIRFVIQRFNQSKSR